MSDYTKTTNFTAKDALAPGTPAKKILGADHDTEYDAIAVAIATKADKASPTFTGTPAAPTAAVDTNTTQIATTAFVIGQGYVKAASPALTGTPTAPTAAADTNTTQLATTAFVVGQGYLKSATAASTYAALASSPTFTGDVKSSNGALWAYGVGGNNNRGIFYGNSTGSQYVQNQNDVWDVSGSWSAGGLLYGRGGGNGLGQITVSTLDPSGGAEGDIWLKY